MPYWPIIWTRMANKMCDLSVEITSYEMHNSQHSSSKRCCRNRYRTIAIKVFTEKLTSNSLQKSCWQSVVRSIADTLFTWKTHNYSQESNWEINNKKNVVKLFTGRFLSNYLRKNGSHVFGKGLDLAPITWTICRTLEMKKTVLNSSRKKIVAKLDDEIVHVATS